MWVVYAELSLNFKTLEALDDTIDELALEMAELPRPALFLTGKAFLKYCRSGGMRSNVLADFFIGAHAAVFGHPILTRDSQRYCTDFPECPYSRLNP